VFYNSSELEKRILVFPDNYDNDYVKKFLETRNIDSFPFSFYNNDSFRRTENHHLLNKGLLRVSNNFDTILVPGSDFNELKESKLNFSPHVSTKQSVVLKTILGTSLIKSEKANEGLFISNRNLGGDTVLYIAASGESFKFGTSPDFYLALYSQIHSDTLGFGKWQNITKQLKSFSNMSAINIYDFVFGENEVFVFGTFNDLFDPQSKDIGIIPRYYIAEIKNGFLSKPKYIKSHNGIQSAKHFDGRLNYQIANFSKQDTLDLDKGIVGFYYNNKYKRCDITLTRKVKRTYDKPTSQLDYHDIKEKLIISNSVLIDYGLEESLRYKIQRHAKNIMNVYKLDSGFIICSYNDNMDFYIDYFDKNLGSTFTVFQDNFDNYASNISLSSSRLSIVSKSGDIVEMQFE
jgi:hypothetical protein